MTDGPAFPTTTMTESGMIITDDMGMSLRDYFAARAMQGLVHDILIDQPIEDSLISSLRLRPDEFPAYLAHLAYRTAEAMLAERAKSIENPTPYTPVPKS